MSFDIDREDSQTRVRSRRFVRWVTLGMGVIGYGTVIAVNIIPPELLFGQVPRGLLIVSACLGVLGTFVHLGVIVQQRSAVNGLSLPLRMELPREEWTEKSDTHQVRVAGVFGGIIVALVGLISMGPLVLTIGFDMQLGVGVGQLSFVWMFVALFGVPVLTGLLLRRWLASGDDTHALWALKWLPGAERVDVRSLAFQVLNAPGAATDLVGPVPGRRRTASIHAAYLCVLAREEPDVALPAFLALHNAAPEHPVGSMGLSDVALQLGHSVPLATRHAEQRSARSMFWGHLHPYARANSARCLALEGDDEAALRVVTEVLLSTEDEPPRRRAGVMHRLACAVETLDPQRAQALRGSASELDPTGEVGRRAADNLPPLPYWV